MVVELRRAKLAVRQHSPLVFFVFLPFAAGYYLSYLFRTINALISARLVSELGLSAADLGLLTAVYFLTFAAAQLPVGVLLDRLGPRRVQSALLLIAAGGAALFGSAQGYVSLVIARALIGLGVAAALMAGFKATVLWFPKDRLPLVNGWMVTLGAMGAVTATGPAELLLRWTDWRGLFDVLAALTLASAGAIYFLVPEPKRCPQPSSGQVSVMAIYREPRFWRMAPLSASMIGTAWSLHGLWAAPWLRDVEQMDQSCVVTLLLAMAIALSAGALSFGIACDRLRKRGIGPTPVLVVVAAAFITVQFCLVLRAPVPAILLWAAVAAVGAATVLSYAMLAEYFPKELAGRANGALNVFHIGGAFAVQYSTGLVIQLWASQDGHYPLIAYQAAFGINIALQAAALAWFIWPRIQVVIPFKLSVRAQIPKSLGAYPTSRRGVYNEAARIWADRLEHARGQARTWRLAGLISTTLSVLLGCAILVSATRASVIPYMKKVAQIDPALGVDADLTKLHPSDGQIAYFLARFVTDVRSLSTDPIVVRHNWSEALAFATDDVGQLLNASLTTGNWFGQIGARAIAVEVAYIVRASPNSFEISWREQIFEKGAIVGTRQFTGLATIIVDRAPATEILSTNPVGLHIRDFTWSPTVQ
jgi:type IV secretory pathway TrbF-like protein/sugar phosphate permease